jgi:hypothetical protein
MIRKSIVFFFLILIQGNILAGVNGLTYHSRANCFGNNESISWDLTGSHMLRTLSYHMPPDNTEPCNLDTGWENTWRSAAVHFLEGTGWWTVFGTHYIRENNEERFLQMESVMDCAIYDGWWEYK